MTINFPRLAICLSTTAIVCSFAVEPATASPRTSAETERTAPTRLAQFNWLGGDAKSTATAKKEDGGAKTAQGAGKADTKAAAPAAPAAPSSAWAVTCTDRGGSFVCEMTQSVIEQKSRRQLLLMSVKHSKDSKGSAMLFRLPHGIYIPAGVTVKIDGGKASKLEFQKSDQYGIYAALPLSADLLGAMKKGKELDIDVEINKGQPFQLKGQLTGFGPAYDKITSLN